MLSERRARLRENGSLDPSGRVTLNGVSQIEERYRSSMEVADDGLGYCLRRSLAIRGCGIGLPAQDRDSTGAAARIWRMVV
jgi:hypothetical protein